MTSLNIKPFFMVSGDAALSACGDEQPTPTPERPTSIPCVKSFLQVGRNLRAGSFNQDRTGYLPRQ